MNFEIDIDGRTRSVSVERVSGQRYRVTVDGRVHDIDADRAGAFQWSLLVDGEAGVSREIAVAPSGRRGEMLVALEGRTVAVALNSRRTGRGPGDEGGADGEVTVSAPMPGRVLRILVAPGDDVVPRQPVAVVEAMKMENELRAPKAGRVKDVCAAPGTSVEAGRALVVIE